MNVIITKHHMNSEHVRKPILYEGLATNKKERLSVTLYFRGQVTFSTHTLTKKSIIFLLYGYTLYISLLPLKKNLPSTMYINITHCNARIVRMLFQVPQYKCLRFFYGFELIKTQIN